MNTTCICVLNYNNGLKTVRCISSILKQTIDSYNIIIIDNHSTDNSFLVIKLFLEENKRPYRVLSSPDEKPGRSPVPGEIILIRSGRNGGYSYGNNLGIRLAKSFSLFSHLLILNNDTVMKENFLEEMAGCFEDLRMKYKTEKLAFGATELGWDGKIHHHGFHYLHLLSGIMFLSPVFPSFRYIAGSCIFTDIGAPLMDESFFLYFDDAHYSKLLARNGYRLESSVRSVFIHEVGGTEIRNKQGMIFRGLLRFYWLNWPLLLPVVVPVRILLLVYLWIRRLTMAHG
jgi:GT2 family glycosyltransferase